MDLDKLKESWQKTDAKSTMDESKIQLIINHQGQSAFRSLIKTERILLITYIICVFLSFVFRDLLCIIVYLASIVLGFVWQIYKYKFLKKIHLTEMPLLDIADKIATYKKYLYKEIYIGCVWAIGFLILWIVRVVAQDLIRISPGHKISIFLLIIIFMGMFLFVGVISVALYKILYLDKIETIKEAIKDAEEVADFENDEQ